MQSKLVGDLGCVHGIWQILLVCKDQEKGISELVLVEHSLHLFTGLDDTVTIVRVDYEDDTLGVLEVFVVMRALAEFRKPASARHIQCLHRGRILS